MALREEIEKALKHEESGDLAAALELLDHLCNVHPDSGEAWLEHALLLDKHDREADAIPKYQKALSYGLNPDQERTALTCLASSYRNVGEMQLALETIEDANSRFPENAVVESFLALIQHDSGLEAKALQTLGRTLLRVAMPGSLSGFEGALEYKFTELTTSTE